MRSSFICVSAKSQLRLDTICAVKIPKRSARWTDELTVELIEEFRKHPELWKFVVSRSLGDIAGRITVSCLTMYGVTALSNLLKAVSSIGREFLKSSGLFSCN
jgi:hypothetical protein